MIPADETAAEQRARWQQWAKDEPDPYYRHQFWLASLTPRQRLARWWWINRPIVLTMILLLAVAIGMALLTL